jgi:hypothetical protein
MKGTPVEAARALRQSDNSAACGVRGRAGSQHSPMLDSRSDRRIGGSFALAQSSQRRDPLEIAPFVASARFDGFVMPTVTVSTGGDRTPAAGARIVCAEWVGNHVRRTVLSECRRLQEAQMKLHQNHRPSHTLLLPRGGLGARAQPEGYRGDHGPWVGALQAVHH